ncbi:endonuclease [Burkholderia contaminans]|nr:endonuclease [Burkholderia contaminans LMG 23361]MBH9690941.1 HNH endonuclease [Burkholderia contaminans]MBY4823388.1 HNH endonuclease [Burkholderia contaminans]MBY4854074.1 HNH endonuclease [Burkholderia contaminans]MBY4879993.1 HNH endonuclease [Burkholderia contaminans]
MMVNPPPSAEQQLAFLTKLQRLFAEGDFTATYKFALLIALSDLAVELGADDGAELPLMTRQIAEQFVQQYWRHAVPYGTDQIHATPGVLAQNLGTQAAVLTAIEEFRSTLSSTTLQKARGEVGYGPLLSKVAAVVSAQPLTYLQNFGGMTDPFLYERPGRGIVVLRPGVAYCLRRFHPLVQQLARNHWVEHIKANRRNQGILGDAGDLEDFLFGTSRQSLGIIGASLRKLDGSRCFYCGQGLQEADVDHFVPFALYPRDLAHNFVLAHVQCNRSKSDSLASKGHLQRWLERLTTKAGQLGEIGMAAGVATDDKTAHRVAAWGYANAHAAQGRAWIKASDYEVVSADYLAQLTPG